MNLDRVIITDPPEYATRYHHDPLIENLEMLDFSPEEDKKINRASQFGPNAIKRALAGDAEAMADLRRLHLIMWQHNRVKGEQP